MHLRDLLSVAMLETAVTSFLLTKKRLEAYRSWEGKVKPCSCVVHDVTRTIKESLLSSKYGAETFSVLILNPYSWLIALAAVTSQRYINQAANLIQIQIVILNVSSNDRQGKKGSSRCRKLVKIDLN